MTSVSQAFTAPQQATLPALRYLAATATIALAGLASFGSSGSAAQTTASTAKVNHLTSFHEYSETITTPTSPLGWPGAQRPTSPPLYSVHPTLQRAYLYGGFAGQNRNIARGAENLRSGAGLYWLPTIPGVYERLSISSMTQAVDTELYGRITGTPVQAADGRLYGIMTSVQGESTTNFGADGKATIGARYLFTATVGRGVVFRTDFDGTHMTAATQPGDLYTPNGALVRDGAGNLYGIDKGPQGHGRIFKVTLSGQVGSVTTVHEFAAGPNGTAQVANGMVIGSDGWLYGVTGYNRGIPFQAGTPAAGNTPVGTVYRINPAAPGSFRVLHTFTLDEGEINVLDNASHAHASGSRGLSWLIEGPDGWLYGTTTPTCQGAFNANAPWVSAGTTLGGSPQCGSHMRARQYGALPYPYYDGSVPHGALYRIRKDGTGSLQLLHKFSDTDGSAPRGPLTVGADGAIYGTTLTGGANRHWYGGTTKGNLDNKPTCGDLDFVSWQNACQAAGADNYDTLLNYGQAVSDGVMYRIVPGAIVIDGAGAVQASGFELVHSFKRDIDGLHPLGLSSGADGRLYGVTANGGTSYKNANGVQVSQDDEGTVFQVDLDGASSSAGITLILSPAEIRAGEKATLTWTSNQARDCRSESSAGDWTGPIATAGSVELTKTGGTYRYSVVCFDSVRGTEIASTLMTLYVGVPATAESGNSTSYGNGGGGPAAPALLLPLAGLWWLRRRTGR